jgi:rhamnose transport system permease protein
MNSSRLAIVLRWAPVLIPAALLCLMLVRNPTLRHIETWGRIARIWVGVAVLAMASTPIIITGGIDLSVGSIVGLSAVVAGMLWRDWGCPIPLAFAGSLATGLLAGVLNGSIVLAGVNPLVVTLATLAVFRGMAYGLSGAQAVDNFPAGLRQWWDGSLLGIPNPAWIGALAFAFGYAFLHWSWMGRMLYAMGDNPEAARFAAVPVRTLTFALYAASGFFAGLVGLMTVCEFRSSPANTGEGLELRAIACVVLGGVRITGGSGDLIGTLLGVVTLAALLEGMVSVPYRWRMVVIGAFLIVIVIANETAARLRARCELTA